MSNLRLHYFDMRGRAEFARIIFAVAGIKFEDVRVKVADWDSVKPTTPLGQLPYLEVDGVVIPQSLAVARYAARQGDLLGKTSLQQAQADAIVETVQDLVNAFWQAIGDIDESEYKGVAVKFFYNEGVTYYTRIDKIIGLYGKNGLSAGDSLTWADLFIFEIVHPIKENFPDMFCILSEKYPKMTAVYNNLIQIPHLAEYVKNRPKTDF